MDPRHERVEARLQAAILKLAAQTPVENVTVTALAKEAACGRDTVYRHATDQVDVLIRVLREMLDAVVPVPGTGATIAEGELALLRHLSENAAIYRGALVEVPSGRVRDMLAKVIEENLLAWLELYPRLAPQPSPGAPRQLAREILVAYAASGTVGALMRWLDHGDLSDPEQATQMMLAAAPRWWWDTEESAPSS
jgi:AcrR family transcriptional regulator